MTSQAGAAEAGRSMGGPPAVAFGPKTSERPRDPEMADRGVVA
jgi:hypothetical protein